jgi:hypothetical protein
MAPSSDRLCAAMASILRNAKIHDGQKSGADVIAKWTTIRSNFQSMTDKVPGIRWPHFEVQEDDEDMSGKQHYRFFFLTVPILYTRDPDPQQGPDPERNGVSQICSKPKPDPNQKVGRMILKPRVS